MLNNRIQNLDTKKRSRYQKGDSGRLDTRKKTSRYQKKTHPPKRARFDENGENDEFAFYPLKTMVSLLRRPQTTKMTKMAGVTQEKAWFRKSRVCSSLKLVAYTSSKVCPGSESFSVSNIYPPPSKRGLLTQNKA